MQQIRFIQAGVGNRGAQYLTGFYDRIWRALCRLRWSMSIRPFLPKQSHITGLKSLPTYATLNEALAQQPEAEAVVIVTPARFHTAMVGEALAAGKHVWVEKPLSYDYGEAVGLATLPANNSALW